MTPVERQSDGPSWDDESDLWEHQGEHLTAGALARVLVQVDKALPLLVAVYDGSAITPLLTPVEVGLVGEGEQPDALVITVTSTMPEQAR